MALSTWNVPTYSNSVLQLYLGSNFISRLEIVSSLNSLNIAVYLYSYHEPSGTKKIQSKGVYWCRPKRGKLVEL